MYLSSKFSIHVKDLSKTYQGKFVLSNINLIFDSDESIGCIGSNGAGKTTLLEIISGLKPFDSGNIIFSNDGRETNLPMNWIGYASQSPILWNKLTIEDHFDLLGKFYNIDKINLKLRKDVIWNLFQMNDYKNILVANLSGGWKQRLNLALSLLHNPRILIWDEPSTGLDIETKIILRSVISNYQKEKPTIFIISSHDLTELEKSTQKILILKNGKLIIYGNWKQLKEYYLNNSSAPIENPNLEDIYQVAISQSP